MMHNMQEGVVCNSGIFTSHFPHAYEFVVLSGAVPQARGAVPQGTGFRDYHAFGKS